MMAWVKSLRLSVCVLESFLAATGFVLAGMRVSRVATAVVFLGMVANMLQNDWRDRFHDIRKGKTLAYERPRAFLALLTAVWVVDAGLIILASASNAKLGITLATLGAAGMVYSETRRIPVAPIAIVSLVSAGPVILPLADGASSEKLLPLFMSTILVIFAREVAKDIDDEGIDRGYKWTIPLALGGRRSRALAAAAIVLGSAVAAKVSLAVLPGAAIMVAAAVALARGAKPHTVRRCLDAGMALAILALIVSSR